MSHDGAETGRPNTDGLSAAPTAAPRARHLLFDTPTEIFASDSSGSFVFPLEHSGSGKIDMASFDELRMVISVWHPSEKQSVDLDRAYVELRVAFESDPPRWIRLAEFEPVVPPSNAGESFDGWIVLPVLAPTVFLRLCGSGFEPRARLQIRNSLYLVG